MPLQPTSYPVTVTWSLVHQTSLSPLLDPHPNCKVQKVGVAPKTVDLDARFGVESCTCCWVHVSLSEKVCVWQSTEDSFRAPDLLTTAL
mmetsp:Transcript_20954/g.37442  ORF Transcript_20954/g.37442 Transcript_20954/m.37442 type:complete len:89 (-) Transcript_20954:177-443(-)